MTDTAIPPLFRLVMGKATTEWRRLSAVDTAQRLHRLKRLTGILLTIPFAGVLYLGLRLLNLVRPVRIGTLNAKGRFSIMVSYIEPYVRRWRLREGTPRGVLIVINPGTCPNEYLSRMYGRAIWLLDDRRPWRRRLFSVTHWSFTSRSMLNAPLRSGHIREFAEAWQVGQPVLRLTDEEQAAGQHMLRQMGIPPQAPYICVGLREAAYYQQFLTPDARARHPNPEAEEDTYIRNPSLQSYVPMLSQCASEGFYVLRMGQVVEAPLPPGLPERVIDYAALHRTSFGDVFLLAACRFVVAGGGTGLWWIGSAFNRPVVITDSYNVQFRGLRQGDLFIPQTFWLMAEKRLMTFRGMLAVKMRYSYRSRCLRDGVEMIHNTPDEISAVVQEMRQRLDGTWHAQEEDEELQRRFRALYTPEHAGYGMPGRIGAEFLRQHADLLR